MTFLPARSRQSRWGDQAFATKAYEPGRRFVQESRCQRNVQESRCQRMLLIAVTMATALLPLRCWHCAAAWALLPAVSACRLCLPLLLHSAAAAPACRPCCYCSCVSRLPHGGDDSKTSGVQDYSRTARIQKASRNPGVQDFRSPGLQESICATLHAPLQAAVAVKAAALPAQYTVRSACIRVFML